MIAIHELQNPIDIHCEKGYGKAFIIIDYGPEINSMFKVRLHESGKVINVFEDELLIYENMANGEPKINIPTEWKQ